jgi:hypothetical protein
MCEPHGNAKANDALTDNGGDCTPCTRFEAVVRLETWYGTERSGAIEYGGSNGTYNVPPQLLGT